MKEIGLANVVDYFAPGWCRNMIGEKSFDNIFQLEGISLSWFFQRFLSVHTMPPQLQMACLINALNEGRDVDFDSKRSKTTKHLRWLYNLNEHTKIATHRLLKKRNNAQGREKVLFITYPNHLLQDGEVGRIQGVIKELHTNHDLEPFVLTVCPTSEKFYRDAKKIRDSPHSIYQYVTSDLKKAARKDATFLSQKWDSLTMDDLTRIFGDQNVWNCLRYPLNFYFSREFIYFTSLYYLACKQVLSQNMVSVVALTAYNGLVERCMAAAAHVMNIPVILIQHGSGQGSIPLLPLSPYRMAVFSEHYKKKLHEKGIPKENTFVTGPLVFDKILKYRNEHNVKRNNNNQRIEILVTTEPDVEQGLITEKEFFWKVDKLLQDITKIPHCRITIKLHPRQKICQPFDMVVKKYPGTSVVRDKENIYDHINRSDIIINTGLSTVAIESFILDTPVLLVDFARHNREGVKRMTDSRALLEADIIQPIDQIVQEILQDDATLEYREKLVMEKCGQLDGKSAKRIAGLIERTARQFRDKSYKEKNVSIV